MIRAEHTLRCQGTNQILLVEIRIGISPRRNQNCDLYQQDFKSCQYRLQFKISTRRNPNLDYH